MENFSNDELVNAIVSDVLERMKLVDKPTISWQQFVGVHKGNITKPEIVARANKLLDDILIDEFGSLEKFDKIIAKQQKQYDDYVKRIDRNKKQAEKVVTKLSVKPSPALPSIPDETPVDVKPDVKPSNQIASKIGVKRRNKTLEEVAKEQGYQTIEEYIFWERNNR